MKKSAPVTILLAEDDLDDQELLEEAFCSIDPTVSLLAFSTGKKFMEYLENLSEKELPSLILLDYNIPEMNGSDILKILKSKEKYDHIIKLIWSTSDSPHYQQHCMQAGASAYLVKPSNIAALEEMAKEILSFIK